MRTVASPWIRNFQPAPDAPAQLVCLPHAGGSATFYLPVARALAPGTDVLAIQYPGRQDRRREGFVPSVQQMAELIAGEIRALLDRPTALFGHSMGAAIGFEVAALLEADGVDLLGLFVSGRRAPSATRDEAVHRLADRELIEELKRLEGTEPTVFDDDELVQMFLPVVRADYRAIETYRHRGGPALRCPIVVLTGDTDPHVTRAEAEAWAQHTTGGYELVSFRGGHFYLLDHAGQVIGVLSERISGALAAH
ncbi:alpha/beta fold hydrolase [Dactylosporangium sp. NPDC000555]|uniref:thioesterase II family protein n=1 Tax=Dactylosporangium sp. NPDC000555 TaxID=3154260 RepID=UPI0033318167